MADKFDKYALLKQDFSGGFSGEHQQMAAQLLNAVRGHGQGGQLQSTTIIQAVKKEDYDLYALALNILGVAFEPSPKQHAGDRHPKKPRGLSVNTDAFHQALEGILGKEARERGHHVQRAKPPRYPGGGGQAR